MTTSHRSKLNPMVHLFWLGCVALSILLSVAPASAQFGSGSGNSGSGGVEAILRGLQDMQSRGALDTQGGDLLDRTRRQGDERAPASTTNVVRLSSLELQVVRQYCSNPTNLENRRLIEAVSSFSDIERDFCLRAKQYLPQFGYELFDGVFRPDRLVTGAIQDNYIMGVGDEVVVTLRGQRTNTQALKVDREGRLVVPEMPPIVAAGRSVAAVRADLETRVAQSFVGSDVYLSVGAVRNVSVTVIGEVARPGLQQLTGLSSVVDALGVSGGVKKTGSLRRIQLRRGGNATTIDLYDLLMGQGATRDVRLMDGDQIVVPALGNTIAIAGRVTRPGIYELRAGQGDTVSEVVNFAGGAVRPRGSRFAVASLDGQGREIVSESFNAGAAVSPGDLITVEQQDDIQTRVVELLGHVRVPGNRSLDIAPTVGRLLGNYESFKEDPYLLLVVLETTDTKSQARRYFPVNAQKVLDGVEDYTLQHGDRVIVLGQSDIRYLSGEDVQSILRQDLDQLVRRDPQLNQTSDQREREEAQVRALAASQPQSATTQLQSLSQQSALDALRVRAASGQLTQNGALFKERPECKALSTLEEVVLSSRIGRFNSAVLPARPRDALFPSGGYGRDNGESTGVRAPACPEIFDRYPDLVTFLLEHGTVMSGEVRRPGVYPLVPDTSLTVLVAAAGGLSRDVDMTNVELSSFSEKDGQPAGRSVFNLRSQNATTVRVNPGEVVRFNVGATDREAGPVVLAGEFLRPGTYEIRRGEKLSQVIARAGGLTEQAYPYGAVFSRESIKRAEQIANEKLARDLNSAIALASTTRGVNSDSVLIVSNLMRELRSLPPVGRVVIEADPTVLQVKPELDILLQPGDQITVPKRPSSVLVTGDVLNPGALQFVPGSKAESYVQQAGGLQKSADGDRVFVILPNGIARPVSVSAFTFSTVQIPPGSTIVVPKDPRPFDFFNFARDIGSLVSQLALTAASLAVISNN